MFSERTEFILLAFALLGDLVSLDTEEFVRALPGFQFFSERGEF